MRVGRVFFTRPGGRPHVGGKMDNEESDEEAPLLAGANLAVARSRPLRSYCTVGLPWIAGIGALHVVLLRSESAITFPYLRSLQRCTDAATAGAEPEWSGSEHCHSRDVVTRLAQAEAGYVHAAGMVVHSLALPFLGALGDTVGRRPLLILSFAGLLVECVLNAAAARIDVLLLGVAVRMGTDATTPALVAMIADCTDVADRHGAYLIVILAAAPAYAMTYLAVTHFVLAQHLHSYQHIWAALCACTVGALLAAALCPETMHRQRLSQSRSSSGEGGGGEHAQHWASGARPASPSDPEAAPPTPTRKAVARDAGDAAATSASADPARGGGRRLCLPTRAMSWLCGCARAKQPEGVRGTSSSPARSAQEDAEPHPQHAALGAALFAPCMVAELRYLMLVEVPLLIGVSAYSTTDGYALTAYSWEQETMYYARLAILPSAGLAVAASLPLSRTLGPKRTLQLGLASLWCAMSLMCFAQWHPSLLVASLVLAGGLALGLLPALRLLTTRVQPSQQAAATAAVLAVGTASRAVGLALHAFIFQSAVAVGMLYAPFALGAFSLALALAVAVVCAPPPDVWLLPHPHLPEWQRGLQTSQPWARDRDD